MQTNALFFHEWQWALRLGLTALLLVLNAAAGMSAASAESKVSAEKAPLLQVTAGKHVIGFAPTQVTLAAFDHALRYPLTVDLTYQWHTFYGSSNTDDSGYGIVVDGSGNIYIAGFSWETWGTPLHAHSGGCDIVVVKLNSAGAYQWHTFYGSDSDDAGYGIAIDRSGSIYIAGESRDPWGTPLHAHSRGYTDIVVVKLNSAGAYQWHTFYGSASWDMVEGIAIDGSDNVYLTGRSDSTWQGDGNADPLHAHSSGTNDDIVALKLTDAGAYQWHTFYGSDSWDWGHRIAVDVSGNVFITGRSDDTWQGDGDTNPLHAYSGAWDIFALKIGTPIQWYPLYLPLLLKGS